MFVSPCVCESVLLGVCEFVSPIFVCLYVYDFVCLCVSQHVCVSACLGVGMFGFLYVCDFVFISSF